MRRPAPGWWLCGAELGLGVLLFAGGVLSVGALLDRGDAVGTRWLSAVVEIATGLLLVGVRRGAWKGSVLCGWWCGAGLHRAMVAPTGCQCLDGVGAGPALVWTAWLLIGVVGLSQLIGAVRTGALWRQRTRWLCATSFTAVVAMALLVSALVTSDRALVVAVKAEGVREGSEEVWLLEVRHAGGVRTALDRLHSECSCVASTALSQAIPRDGSVILEVRVAREPGVEPVVLVEGRSDREAVWGSARLPQLHER